jgi:hypothetical protein
MGALEENIVKYNNDYPLLSKIGFHHQCITIKRFMVYQCRGLLPSLSGTSKSAWYFTIR